MLLSTIIDIINIIKTFPIGYYYITSELVKAFIIIHSLLLKMIFHNCPGSLVLLSYFSADLASSMKEVQKMPIKEYTIHAKIVIDGTIIIVAKV